jgi:serine/threonine protein kinase
VSKSDF